MKVRRAERADIKPLAELWSHAFPGERTVADRIRQLEAGIPYGGIETAWVVEEGGRIAGAFKAYRFTEYIAGASLPMLGLAAVAVSGAARRRGLGRRMVTDAMRIGRERGDIVSVLYPFRPDFYQALGWGLAGELLACRFRPESLPELDGYEHVRPATPEDRAGITACYARVAQRSNGPIRREAEVWTHHLETPGVHAFVYAPREVHGYLLTRYGRERSPEHRSLYIRELIAETDEAYRGLLGWVSRQRDQWRRVRYDARRSERMTLRLADPRPPGFHPARALWFPTAMALRGPMLRVLDVRAALAARSYGDDDSAIHGTLEIEVRDEQLPENRGPWRLELSPDGAEVRRANGRADARLVTDPATFAQIYAGELSPGVAAWLGRAEVEGAVRLLDRAFVASEPFWLLDEF
ncbi:MAG TPA: GNAT family N-acetyltransferase [Longimicrobiales bacterium]